MFFFCTELCTKAPAYVQTKAHERFKNKGAEAVAKGKQKAESTLTAGVQKSESCASDEAVGFQSW